MTTRRHIRRRVRSRGQALMEFAVVLTLFVALFIGVLEFGRIWSAANVLNAAARDGARLASITEKNAQRVAKAKARAEATAASYFTGKDITVTVAAAKGTDKEPLVTVTATGKLDMIFGNWFLGKKVTMSRTVTMRDETETP